MLVTALISVSILLACNDQPAGKEYSKPVVVMLSLDGFRWDYPDLYETPNLDRMAEMGVKARAIIPSFPTKTFPNHYTMVTGLYPDHHGLVNNTYVDPVRKDTFRLGDRSKVEDEYYYGGEPLWVTAKKQGLKTASFFWVGSEAAIQGIRPDRWKRFDDRIPCGERMDTVLKWLGLPPDTRPDLITWYIEEPDGVAHHHGPFSIETEMMVEQLDSLVGIFLDRLEKLPGKDPINFILTSDHGMGETRPAKWINIMDYMDNSMADYILGYNPVIFIQPSTGMKDSIITLLSGIEHLEIYEKDKIPPHLHYGTNPRIAELVVVADSGWSIDTRDPVEGGPGGAHGYDYLNTDMHAIFYAMGPAFKKGYLTDKFYNIDIYPLICEILELEPAMVDGNLERVESMFPEKHTVRN